MPRFVILTHDCPTLHWDFMLEDEGRLRTWRLLESPDGEGPIDAEAIADHRLEYLDYEGPISGGRGEVKRWDMGEYAPCSAGWKRVAVRLVGKRLRGIAFLESANGGPHWTFRMSRLPSELS